MPEELNEDSQKFSSDATAWQEEVLANCRAWMETVAAAGAAEAVGDVQEKREEEGEEPPDLYSFYEELAILRGEFRKNSRRSHETFAQIGERLDSFQGVLASLGQRLEGFAREREAEEILSRQGLFLRIAELHERLRRLNEKLKEFKDRHDGQGKDCAPGSEAGHRRGGVTGENILPDASPGWRSWFRRFLAGPPPAPPHTPAAGESFTKATVAMIEGISLSLSHFEDFLEREGLTPIPAQGFPFDPAVMSAVGVVATDELPPDTVYEEIATGYLYRGHVLKPALVTVTIENNKQSEE